MNFISDLMNKTQTFLSNILNQFLLLMLHITGSINWGDTQKDSSKRSVHKIYYSIFKRSTIDFNKVNETVNNSACSLPTFKGGWKYQTCLITIGTQMRSGAIKEGLYRPSHSRRVTEPHNDSADMWIHKAGLGRLNKPSHYLVGICPEPKKSCEMCFSNLMQI